MILLGVNAHPAAGDAARRQAGAAESLRRLRGVRLANVQWVDEVHEAPGFETLAVLRGDSRTASGCDGPRKPLVSEAFDALAEAAAARGCRWFGYANSDIQVTQAAVDRVAALGLEAYAFSRMDFDAETGRDLGLVLNGIDLFVVGVEWWRANRRRFRPYVGGEPVWDNVYTSLLLCHARGVLLNREPLVRHERHPASAWGRSPFAAYIALLAARDRPYFTLWAHYHDALLRLRERGAGEDEELALQRRSFRYAPGVGARVVQALRAARATLRYAARRR